MVDRGGHALLRASGAMLALPAAYPILALTSRGGLGAGDVRLAALVGLALGWQSWTAVATGTLLALGYASLAGLVAIAFGRASPSTPMPYGPAMIAGALTAIVGPG